MKYPALPVFSVLLALTTSSAAPPRTGGNYSQPAESFDAGGGNAASVHYSHTVSVGGLGCGISTFGASAVAKNGFAGQLYEVTNVKLTASPTTLDEGGTSLLQTTATLDDATLLRLSSGEVRWRVFLGPVESIDANGRVQFGNVYQDSFSSIEAGYQRKFAGERFLIRNVGLDDFGLYAHDGIPDLWQVQHFGVNNPHGTAAADPDGDGQNNLFEYLAGLSPTNSDSRFTLEIADLRDLPDQKALILSPRLDSRSYRIEYSTDLGAGFTALTNAQQIDFGSTRFVLDPDARAPARFYRVRISMP